MSALRRFWFTFKEPPIFSPLGIGCGITAYDIVDASDILKKKIFHASEIPNLLSIIEDIDVQSLDKNHVIPNMGAVVSRGVWFPLGYE
jgi:hypothetical protein